MTLTTGSNVSMAVKALRDLRVEIPADPSGSLAADASSLAPLSFHLQATVHSPRTLAPLPDFMSTPSRVTFDKTRAVALAALLDEERGVSDETNLAALLNVMAAGADSDVLDVAIAYLRRVHLFVYYSGKSFVNEAQMLVIAPSVVCRSLPPLPPAPSPEDGVKLDVEEKEDEKEDEQEDEKEDAASETKDDGEEPNTSNAEVGGEYPGKTSHAIVALDKRGTEFMTTVARRVELQKADELSQDARDAEVIATAQNKVRNV